MNKKLSSLITEKGGALYHITWATYFMLDAFDSSLGENQNNFLSPSCAFLSTIQYTPITSQDMYNSLLKFEINENNNINDFFRSIFKADEFNLTATAILAQMARNECKEGIKNDKENIVMQYVFRGLIILILTFPPYFAEYKEDLAIETTNKETNKDSKDKIENSFDWNLMAFIIKYLSNSHNEIHDAFLQSFDPLIAPYQKIKSFLVLPHDSPLFLFLLEIVQTIITFSNRFCQMKLYNSLDYISSFFQYSFASMKKNSNSNKDDQNQPNTKPDNYNVFTSENIIVQYFSAFIQILISFQCKDITKHLNNSLRIATSTFLISFQENKNYDENLFAEGTDAITLSIYLQDDSFEDAPTILLFCQGVITFINWASKCFNFEEVFKDVPKYEEKPEMKIIEMPQSYFVSHRGVELHNKFAVSKKPIQCVQFSNLVQTLKATFSHFTNFNFFIQSLVTFYNHVSDLSMTILLIAFPFSKIADFDDCLMNFLTCLLSSDVFDISKTKIIEGLKVPLFDYSLNVFMNIFEIYPQFRQGILQFIFDNLDFKNFLRILPLFRSLLLIADQSNFIYELLQTNFFILIELNLDKPEYKSQVEACMAFILVCVYIDPSLTMSSYNLTNFFTKCLVAKQFKDRVIKCFKLGLAQKPPETIISICTQISIILHRSIEKKEDFELASEFISILSQYLNRFSLSIIDELETKSIFDLISRLPSAMNDRACFMNVLKFFMLLFSRFPSVNEILVRKFVYYNLMNTIDIFHIDDEILAALLSLIMGNEVTLDDDGLNMMKNLSALKSITTTMKKSPDDIKMKYLNFLTNHCVKNAANCFLCFQSDVLDFALECFEIDSLHEISLNLFKIISSLFFSTRDLRLCARTLSKYLEDEDNAHKKEICALIQKLNEMLNETCYDFATSFFHFSSSPTEKITAEVRQETNPSDNGSSNFIDHSNMLIFVKSWVFSSTVSISEFNKKMNVFSIRPIQSSNQQTPSSKSSRSSKVRLLLNRGYSSRSANSQKQDPNKVSQFIECFFESNQLAIQTAKETKKFGFKFISPYWYQISIFFKDKEAILFIDHQFTETIKFSNNISYTGEYEIVIGGGFCGDIGDISFYECPFIQSKQIEFSDITCHNVNSSIQLFPRNFDSHTNTLTNTHATNCTINCSYVPFRTTFKKSVVSSITLSLFLPLINQINNSEVLNYFLMFIQSLFNCSIENEHYFEKICGFPLLIGLIKNFECFDYISCGLLFNLYRSLRTETLKNQMVEYLFFRFDIIFKFSDSFITHYFNKTIHELFILNKEIFYRSKSLLDQMIYSTCKYATKSSLKLLTEEEEANDIEKLKSTSKYTEAIFDFFYEYFEQNIVIEKPIHDLFLIYLFCNDSLLKSRIIDFICKFVNNRKDQILCMLPEFKYYERFYPSIYSHDENEQKSALKLFISFIKLERSKEISTQTLTKVISYIQKNKTLSENTLNILLGEKKEVNYPELLSVFCSGFDFSNNKSVLNKKFVDIIETKSVETFFACDFSPLFMLAYCIDDINLWDTFTPIFIDNPDLLRKTLYILNFFALFMDSDCSPIKKQIFINVLRMTLRKRPKNIQTIANFAVQFYCYRFYINNDTNEHKEKINNISFENVKEFMDWIMTPDSVNKLFSYYASTFDDEDFCYSLYQVLSEIVSESQDINESKSKKTKKAKMDIEPKSISMIQITADDFYQTFSIICILISYIIENSDNSIRKNSMIDFVSKIHVPKAKEQINQIYYSMKKVKFSSPSFHQAFPNAEPSNLLKENFLIVIEDSKTVFKFEWQSPFYRFIKDVQQNFDKEPISSTNKTNYQSFIRTSEEKIEFVESYCSNLSLSFIRETKFIDSRGTSESKFRISNEVDSAGRRLYMSINKYFNDHRIASKNREDGYVVDAPILSTEQESNDITVIKRFLDQKVQQSISSIQYSNDMKKALLITLTGQYDVFYKFDSKSVVIGGKLAFNGFGSELDNDESKSKDGLFSSSGEISAEEKAINNNSAPLKYITINFSDVLFIFSRRFLHERTACEIFSKKRKSYLLNFTSIQEKNAFCSHFKCPENVPKPNKNKEPIYPYNFFKELRRASNGLYQSLSSSELFVRSKVAEAWLSRNISNYQYLYYLNILSGRSFNDTSQYPVYPWVISKYDTDQIDLYDQTTYRDFSVPMAAYSEKRLLEAKQKLEDSFDPIERCMFRSFYSNPAIVIHFLIRCEPFTSLHIVLQSGRFDYADRLFKSIESSFISSSSGEGDFSEILPEFFTNWHFLVNENHFDFGRLQDGQPVNDVVLPKWARNACHFVETNRIALESEYVRCHLNEWIDLIFGCHQKSVEKNNLFHLFNYSDCITNPAVIQDNLISLAQHHALNFGCSPDKLLNESHPVMQVNINLLAPETLVDSSADPYIIQQPQVGSTVTLSANPSSSSVRIKDSLESFEPIKLTLFENVSGSFSGQAKNIDYHHRHHYNKKPQMIKSFSNDHISSELVNSNGQLKINPDLPNENIVFFSDLFYLTELGNFGKVDASIIRKKYSYQENYRNGHENFTDNKNFGFITNIFGHMSKGQQESNKKQRNIALMSDSQSDLEILDSLSSSDVINDSDSMSPISIAQANSNSPAAQRIVVPKNVQMLFLKKSKIFIYIQANGSSAVILPLLKSSFIFNDKSTSSFSGYKLIMHESSPISCICHINEKLIVTGGADCCLNVWPPPWDSDSMYSIPILAQKLISVSGNFELDRIVAVDESSQVFIVSLSKKKLILSFNIQAIIDRERRRMMRRRTSSLRASKSISPSNSNNNNNNASKSSFEYSESIIESSHDELDVDSSHDEIDIESSGDEIDVDSDDDQNKNNKIEGKDNTEINKDIESEIDSESEVDYSESSHDELDFDSDKQVAPNKEEKINSSILCNNTNINSSANNTENDFYFSSWKRISNHRVLLLDNSLIFTTSENDEETRIDLFDLTGKRISSPISFNGEIVKMLKAQNKNVISVILSMSTHHLYIINCHAFDVTVKTIGIFPELVCLSENGDSLVVSDSYRYLSIYDLCNK